jgi:hypothetical protein
MKESIISSSKTFCFQENLERLNRQEGSAETNAPLGMYWIKKAAAKGNRDAKEFLNKTNLEIFVCPYLNCQVGCCCERLKSEWQFAPYSKCN